LAFSAFNCFRWIELIVRATTPVEPGVMVYHYSQSKRFESRNTMFTLGLGDGKHRSNRPAG
jgi:hypothetical protein